MFWFWVCIHTILPLQIDTYYLVIQYNYFWINHYVILWCMTALGRPLTHPFTIIVCDTQYYFHCKLCTNNVHQVGSFLFSCPSRAVVTAIIMIVRVIIHKEAIIEIIMEYTKVVKYTQVAIMKWTDSLRSKKSRKSSLLHLPFKRPIARSTFCLSDKRTVLNLLCWAVKWPLSL